MGNEHNICRIQGQIYAETTSIVISLILKKWDNFESKKISFFSLFGFHNQGYTILIRPINGSGLLISRWLLIIGNDFFLFGCQLIK